MGSAEGVSVMWCPCSRYANNKWKIKTVMGQHLFDYGFMPNYTRWTLHGEGHRMRDKVLRQRIEDCDADGGVGDMLHDYHETHFGEGPQEEEPEATAKAYYEMLEAAQKPLHGQHKGVSAGRHWTPNGLKVSVQPESRRLRQYVDCFWKHASGTSHSTKDNVLGSENPWCT